MCVSVVFILAQLNCSDWFACSKLQLELRRFCPHPEQKHLFVQPKNLWPCLIVTSRSWCFFCFLSAVLCLQMLLPLYWLNGDSPVLSHSCFLSSKTKFTESDPAAPEYRKKTQKTKNNFCVRPQRVRGRRWVGVGKHLSAMMEWKKRIPEIMGWFLPGVPVFFLFVFVCLFFKYSSKAGKGG